jgi:hypothetical protein
MAKPKSDHETVIGSNATGQLMCVAKKITKMSRLEFLKSLLRAGIITANGTLRKEYKKK